MVQGLVNQGNECYRNCVLQLLMHLDSFREFMLHEASDGPVSREMKRFLETYQVEDGLDMFQDPQQRRQQHDAHEYLVALLDRLDEENEQRVSPLFFHHEVMTRFVNTQDASDTKTIVSPETVMLLPFSPSLMTSLGLYQATDHDIAWVSEKHPHADTRASRSYAVSKWPAHLFILIQRGLGVGKIGNAMDIPLFFYNYRLKGCVLHLGNAYYGHYTTVLCDHGKFYYCDDMSVSEIEGDRARALVQNAYLLLYSQA